MPESGDVRGALQWALDELRRARIEEPRLTAELLLGHILSWDRVRVISHPGDPVCAAARERFYSLVRRRAAGEPLQYLTGVQEFFGLSFLVTPAVLIPRPETEILVEKALELAAGFGADRLRFADVGTGSGCIGITFALREPRATGWGIDISKAALRVALENARRHQVVERLQLLCGDLMDCLPARPCFEFLLSNPPYVASRDADALPAMVRDHEPHAALFSGNSGMDIYLRLIPQAAQRLVRGGYLLMEVGAGMSEDVVRLVRQVGLTVESIEPDLQAIPRCIVARRGHG